MDPRLSVALPVLPALAHALVLRWEAAYLAETWGAGWADVVDGLRVLSVWVILFAVVLGVLAYAARHPEAAWAARWFLVVSLMVEVGWLAVLGFLRFADASDASDMGEPSLAIAIASLGTMMVFVAATAAGVATLRRTAVQSRRA
ncbi:hypothetical protein [Virgisporangium aurantiacum]|uniref:Uncharacterized protein n=1 Tax=Virgisporangium aurantiacum TaxID=175570 RepID=A0A8J3Z0I8_9ACTN|nr:hypothetical protein [Virgisporangium aurantiacum]GIJ55414.1 hypothetical protein Vau01_029300 [Virgisporangium aurantiacum]